jgi:NUMOD3 motif
VSGIQGQSFGMLGKKHTPEAKAKMSAARKGVPKSPSHRKKMSLSKLGENNPIWRGDSVGYAGLHVWVRRHFPKPDLCTDCKSEPPRDITNISQEYKRDLSDWEWLCRRCHMTKDGRLARLHVSNIKEKLE